MEGVHGVDVSWLHHSPKDPSYKAVTSVTSPTITKEEETAPTTLHTNGLHTTESPATQDSNGTVFPQTHHGLSHKPHLHNRANPEKAAPTAQPTTKNAKDQKPAPMASPSRRNSWITSISSKFSSNSNPTSHSLTPGPIPNPKAAHSPTLEVSNPFGAAVSPGAKDIKKPDVSSPAPASPKSSHPGFLQSALRRLSSSGGANMGKTAGSGAVCQRRVMNVDNFRDRCEIPDLEASKLKRVAFCVDVEIAAPARYSEDEDDEQDPVPPPRRPSLTQLEHQVEVKKKKDQKLKRSEGAALKNPQVVAEEKDTHGVVKATGEKIESMASSPPEKPVDGAVQVPSRKKEKKKRSEEERKERKEKKRMRALENGSKPAELVREDSSSSAEASPPNENATIASTDKPTTDPLRIYKRCCQLRETPILKRITEQISSPSACPIATPGILSYLDLTGYWMQLSDVITLGDYLAVVPVKKLCLEDCGLGDEAVRVILAGLLAAKSPEQAKHNKKLNKKCSKNPKNTGEQLGVVEKLSLKNNPKISSEGWRHISFFINMSRSLKAIDLSGILLPQAPMVSGSPTTTRGSPPKSGWDIPTLLQKSIAERLAGSNLEELVMGQCGLETDTIEVIVEAVIRCGIRRLGLAHNNMSREGLQHVIRYLQKNNCEGLDLGGNDLREDLHMVADVLDEDNPLYALSLADCKISPASLNSLMPALVRLPNFRFIDLSHNRDLFNNRPNALGLLRKYLPQLPIIKRIHLMDVAMTSEHAIALAEILPEIRTLAHLNILENHLISGLAAPKDENEQEEACALYASLMAAVRVSQTIVCIEIDVPSQESSEVVRALAKQVVAYSLRNMENLPLTEGNDSAIAALVDPHGGEKPTTVPDVLLDLVGHMDGIPENHDQYEPAPDDDYIVGGTGVVKALGICLNRAGDGRRISRDMSTTMNAPSGTTTPPRHMLQDSEVSKGKAKEMSKNLLSSARKIRARLQPALVREARNGGASNMNYKRLQYLDSTLEGMIQRFESEYPETRLGTTVFGEVMKRTNPKNRTGESEVEDSLAVEDDLLTRPEEEDEDSTTALKPALHHHPSDHSLASRQAAEEGRMHRFGQLVRREVLPPDTLDHLHGTTGLEDEPEHLKVLRQRIEAMNGPEIQQRVEKLGSEGALRAIGATRDELREIEKNGLDGEERRAMLDHLIRGNSLGQDQIRET